MNELRFSENWNRKLDCKSFTTLRLSSRFEIGDKVSILFKSETKGTVKVIGKKELKLHQINEYVAELDTGYTAEECRTLLKTMYKHKNINWTSQKIYFYLLKYDKVAPKR